MTYIKRSKLIKVLIHIHWFLLIMAIRNSKNIIPMFLAIFPPIFIADSVQGLENEEVMNLDRQLKLINKPALKSFQVNFFKKIQC